VDKKELAKQSFEISYAVLRVGGASKDRIFAEHLKTQALELTTAAPSGDIERMRVALDTLTNLLALGEEFNLVNSLNVHAIAGAVKRFESAITEFEAMKVPEVSLEGVFTAPLFAMPAPKREEVPSIVPDQKPAISQNEANMNPAKSETASFGSLGELIGKIAYEKRRDSVNTRQSGILEKIRQSGNCRLKDLQDFLPDTSERTIRYDLQTLIERGYITRIGNGGPATFYRAEKA